MDKWGKRNNQSNSHIQASLVVLYYLPHSSCIWLYRTKLKERTGRTIKFLSESYPKSKEQTQNFAAVMEQRSLTTASDAFI